MASEIKIPKGTTVKSIKIKIKFSKSELVKALDECGQRESALCLKNWDELDQGAEQFLKSKDAELDKSQQNEAGMAAFKQATKDVAKGVARDVAGAYLKSKLKI
jgi:hypothetical protein